MSYSYPHAKHGMLIYNYQHTE